MDHFRAVREVYIFGLAALHRFPKESFTKAEMINLYLLPGSVVSMLECALGCDDQELNLVYLNPFDPNN